MTQRQSPIAEQTEVAIERLETKLAYQEITLQALNDALVEQQGRIDQLERLTQALLERVQRADDGAGTFAASQRDEPPPHY